MSHASSTIDFGCHSRFEGIQPAPEIGFKIWLGKEYMASLEPIAVSGKYITSIIGNKPLSTISYVPR
jgi:hypothetical protein